MYRCLNPNQDTINYDYDILLIIKFQRAGNYVKIRKFSQLLPYCTSRYFFFLYFKVIHDGMCNL